MIKIKHIKAAWIEQILEFDEPQELEAYLMDLEAKKSAYIIMNRNGTSLQIRKKYNNNAFPKKEGE